MLLLLQRSNLKHTPPFDVNKIECDVFKIEELLWHFLRYRYKSLLLKTDFPKKKYYASFTVSGSRDGEQRRVSRKKKKKEMEVVHAHIFDIKIVSLINIDIQFVCMSVSMHCLASLSITIWHCYRFLRFYVL